MTPQQNQCSTRCAHHCPISNGCKLSEALLDWRGEPTPGRPWACMYLIQPHNDKDSV